MSGTVLGSWNTEVNKTDLENPTLHGVHSNQPILFIFIDLNQKMFIFISKVFHIEINSVQVLFPFLKSMGF